MRFDFESFCLFDHRSPFLHLPPSHTLHKAADDGDLTDKIVEHPSKESQDCGKIRFVFHNNLILSM